MEAVDQLATHPSAQDNINTALAIDEEAQLRRILADRVSAFDVKQNRMSQRPDQRAHLGLQINLLSQKELTKVLQLQQLICASPQIPEANHDEEVAELSSETIAGNIAQAIDRECQRMHNWSA